MNRMGKHSYILRSAAVLPLPLLFAAPVYGVGWAVVALFYLSFFTYFADEILIANRDSGALQGQSTSTYSELVPLILAIGHLLLLPLAVLFLATTPASLLDKTLNFMALSLYIGTVSTANAHELIHRRGRLRNSLGKWVFISLLFGHHVSAHLSVHHPFVATSRDPNSARLGTGFYRFLLVSWMGSFREGLRMEKARHKETGIAGLIHNPYTIYIAGAAVFIMLAAVLGGAKAVFIYVALAGFSQTQLLLADYVQHYGLHRKQWPDGRYEPVSIHHSWNAPHAFSTALLLNASRHSDHHAHPSISYNNLRNYASRGAPMLPYSIPIMSIIALFPSQWHALMAPRVREWEEWHGELTDKNLPQLG